MLPILYIIIPCYNEEKVLPITSGMFLDKIDHGEREGESESKIQERKRSRRERGNRGVIPLSVLIAKQTDWLYWAGLFKLISNY